MAQLNLRTLTPDEKERFYYQTGLIEVADLYARIAELEDQRHDYENNYILQVDYDAKVSALEEAERLHKKTILDLLAVEP